MNYFLSFCLLLITNLSLIQAQVLGIDASNVSPNSPRITVDEQKNAWILANYYSGTSNPDRGLMLHRLENGLNWKWAVHLEDRFLNSFRLITLPSGAALIAVLEVKDGQTIVALLEVATNGTVIRYQNLEFPYYSLNLNNLINTPQGYLLTVSENTAPTRVHLLQFDLTGNLQWEQFAWGSLNGIDAVSDENGNIYQLIAANPVGSGVTRLPKMLVFDKFGNLKKSFAIQCGYEPQSYAICLTSDHKIVCAGALQDSAFAKPVYWMMKMDTSGTPLWSYAYEHANMASQFYHRLSADEAGGVYWQGIQTQGNSGIGTITRVDKDGAIIWNKIPPFTNTLFDLSWKGAQLFSLGYAPSPDLNRKLLVFQMNADGELPSCCSDSLVLERRAQPASIVTVNYALGNGVSISPGGIQLNPVTWAVSEYCSVLDLAITPGVICPNDCTAAAIAGLKDPLALTNWQFPGAVPEIAIGDQVTACYSFPGKYEITAMVDLNGQCSRELTDSIEVCSPDYIPNAFTPNGDMANDTFSPWFYFPVSNYILKIFDRWGNKVFETTSPAERWDGTFNNQAAPVDVYIWTLQYTGGIPGNLSTQNKTGEVALIR